MEKLLDLVHKIGTPLEFAAQNSWQHLPRIRDLEKSMQFLTDNLENELCRAFLAENNKEPIDVLQPLCRQFAGLFIGYEKWDLNDKAQCIEKARLLLEHIERKIKHVMSRDQSSTGLQESTLREFPGLDRARTCFHMLSMPVISLKGIGPKTAGLLQKKGIKTVEDLLYFLPLRYEDRRFPVAISQARPGVRETLVTVVTHSEIKRYGRRPVFEATVADDSGSMKIKWFKGNSAYLRSAFKSGNRVILTGNIGQFGLQKEMLHPDFEILDNDGDNLLHFKRIVPIYSETEGLHQKNIRRIMKLAVEKYAASVLSPLPAEIIARYKLMDIHEAIRQVHFPSPEQNMEEYNSGRSKARNRLIFDEFFFFQLGMAVKKSGQDLKPGIAFKGCGKKLESFYAKLPFELTSAQRRVISEINEDMIRPSPMHRLLQGDVGCGKTLVALTAMMTACDNDYQAALMAPTEILAEQHFRNLSAFTRDLQISMLLLTGNMSLKEKKDKYALIKSGQAQIVIGTHALIQEEVLFKNLGLAVIDEQHRFGVVQRALIRGKGFNPDILVMTATPIPRTLAMTVYGDLDVSVIDEMPAGKKPVKTTVMGDRNRPKLYGLVRREVQKGYQVFVVYPLVEESEHLDMKDATRMAEHLKKEIFPDLRIGLIHGKMKREEKDAIMRDFSSGNMDILVATTVIEVGIDVPQASLMIIEQAERFGLSQLHQLRGRVGRSEIPSSCILVAGTTGSDKSKERLRIMAKTNDGFMIAEEDLALRGPGEFMGIRQSGLPDFRIADLILDGKILSDAKNSAFSLIQDDPSLSNEGNRLLKEVLLRRWEGRLEIAGTA